MDSADKEFTIIGIDLKDDLNKEQIGVRVPASLWRKAYTLTKYTFRNVGICH